jgi:hypothetical protein
MWLLFPAYKQNVSFSGVTVFEFFLLDITRTSACSYPLKQISSRGITIERKLVLDFAEDSDSQ